MIHHPAEGAWPQRRRLQLRAGVFLAAALLALAGWLLAGAPLRLEVANCDSGRVALRVAVEPQTAFSIRFLHSYDRAFVEEHYRVLGPGRILMTRITLRSSLNGEGFVKGTYRAKPDGSAELADIDEEITQVTFRLGSPDLADHKLLIGGRRLRLLEVAQAGDLLCIEVRPLSLLARLQEPFQTAATAAFHLLERGLTRS